MNESRHTYEWVNCFVCVFNYVDVFVFSSMLVYFLYLSPHVFTHLHIFVYSLVRVYISWISIVFTFIFHTYPPIHIAQHMSIVYMRVFCVYTYIVRIHMLHVCFYSIPIPPSTSRAATSQAPTLSSQSPSHTTTMMYIQCFCIYHFSENAFTFHTYPPIHIARIHITSAHPFISIPPPHNL